MGKNGQEWTTMDINGQQWTTIRDATCICDAVLVKELDTPASNFTCANLCFYPFHNRLFPAYHAYYKINTKYLILCHYIIKPKSWIKSSGNNLQSVWSINCILYKAFNYHRLGFSYFIMNITLR